MRPKKPARHTVSILTGRKKTQFSHLCSSVIPYPIGTKFATDVPASYGSLHTKFEENRSSHFRDTSEQNFILISSFFSSSTSSFRTLRKIRHKTRMRAPIGLKFGTLEGLIKADLSTNFGRNPMFMFMFLIHWPTQIAAILLPVAFGLMIEKSVGLMNNVCVKLKGHHSHLLCSQLWEE